MLGLKGQMKLNEILNSISQKRSTFAVHTVVNARKASALTISIPIQENLDITIPYLTAETHLLRSEIHFGDQD